MSDASRHSPEHGPFNFRPRQSHPMHADEHWLHHHWYEAPREDPKFPEIYVYTDAISYAPGDEVKFHASGAARQWSLQIHRDGLKPELVHEAPAIAGELVPYPKDAYRAGCRWPVRHRWQLPKDLRSGFYRIAATCPREDGTRFVQHHFFVVRPNQATRQAKLLLLLPTATWTSYNDWGGANHYLGIDGPDGNLASPILSLERPWTRGIVWLPEGAPRICAPHPPAIGELPQYPMKEWAFANGFGQYYAAAGWAQYDRHFVCWAEQHGYALDMITQTDLEYRPGILSDYPCVVIVGHDEYWTHNMRVALDGYVERGGHVARFGANFLWQIRLENEGRTQVCYKFRAAAEDPVRNGPDKHLLTTAWEDKLVNNPGATTVGVNGLRGVYASWGGFAPRGQRGFTVYRPDHWVFDRTSLHYADIFGAEANIFAYEVDGLDYTFRDGLPYPTGKDGAPASVDILAMAPAVLAEDEPPGPGLRYYIRDSDLNGLVISADGELTEAGRKKYRYGSGMLVHMDKGKGSVVTAATCEWVMGLKRRDPFTEQITRNVLDRFSAR